MVYPEGHAARHDDFAFSDIGPSLDFEMICESAGGLGIRVHDPAEVSTAIHRALTEVATGRQVLLNVIAH